MKIFEQLGFSDNEEKVYLHLLKNGSGSIRQIAGDTGINRGTVYEALKELSDRGLVSHSQKKQRQHNTHDTSPNADQHRFGQDLPNDAAARRA